MKVTSNCFLNTITMKIYLLVLLVLVVVDAKKCKKKLKEAEEELKVCEEEKAEQAAEIERLRMDIKNLTMKVESQAKEIRLQQMKIVKQLAEIKVLQMKIKKLEEQCGERNYTSCKEAYDAGQREDRVYMLNLTSGKTPVYCQMSDVKGCGSGGFTLVMKIDGEKKNFLYDSELWTNKDVFNVPGGATGFDNQETKLPTYFETPFSKVCLGMKVGDDLRFISIDQEASSLYSLIADGQFRPTSLGRDMWKSLIADSSLQTNCNKEGFNAGGDIPDRAKARIGISSNQENDCNSNDSRIGFGTGGSMDKEASCGNSAGWYPDNGNKEIKAFGYIFVQ